MTLKYKFGQQVDQGHCQSQSQGFLHLFRLRRRITMIKRHFLLTIVEGVINYFRRSGTNFFFHIFCKRSIYMELGRQYFSIILELEYISKFFHALPPRQSNGCPLSNIQENKLLPADYSINKKDFRCYFVGGPISIDRCCIYSIKTDNMSVQAKNRQYI